jgi:hypothetical protein
MSLNTATGLKPVDHHLMMASMFGDAKDEVGSRTHAPVIEMLDTFVGAVDKIQPAERQLLAAHHPSAVMTMANDVRNDAGWDIFYKEQQAARKAERRLIAANTQAARPKKVREKEIDDPKPEVH